MTLSIFTDSGGIMKCDVIASGIVEAAKEVGEIVGMFL